MANLLITLAISMISMMMDQVVGQPGTAFPLTDEQWRSTFDAHNEARNAAASGTQASAGGTMPSATNMNSLVWDPALASLAQDTANLCDGQHSAVTTADLVGRNPRFDLPATPVQLGENLAFTSADPSIAIPLQATQLWIGEVGLYTFGPVPTGGEPATGHYTAIIWANTRYMGCAMSDCPDLELSTVVVCQYYTPGNVVGSEPYLTGTPCSACDADRTVQCDADNSAASSLCGGGLTGTNAICDDGLGRDICGETIAPSTSPSGFPSLSPTAPTTAMPTVSPTTGAPSTPPTSAPSGSPTIPTLNPSMAPSTPPTSSPSGVPSATPTGVPSATPTAVTGNPSATPSAAPFATPTSSPVVTATTGAPTAITQNPLYLLLAPIVGDTAARVILASDLTDAQIIALAALITSGASDAEILAFLRSTGIPEAQVLAIAVALDLDLDGDDDDDSSLSISISIGGSGSSDDSSS